MSLVSALVSAQDASAPLMETAMEIIARATTSSSVLSFNLTGVVILIILKIAMVAYALLNTGNFDLNVFGSRSLYSPPGYTESDLTGAMCFLLYTNGNEDKINCLSRATCESPELATDYLSAAKMWFKMHQLIKVEDTSVLNYTQMY